MKLPKKIIKKYLATLSDEDKDSAYCTSREFAEIELAHFQDWLTSKNMAMFLHILEPQDLTKYDELYSWLYSILESWLHTWDDLEDEEPSQLRKIVSKLEKGKKMEDMSKKELQHVIFHLWQVYQTGE